MIIERSKNIMITTFGKINTKIETILKLRAFYKMRKFNKNKNVL